MGSNEDIQRLAQELVANRIATEPKAEEPVEQAPASTEEQVDEDQSKEVETSEEEQYIDYMANGLPRKAPYKKAQELLAGEFNYTKRMQELPELVKVETNKAIEERTREIVANRNRLLESCDMVENFYGKPFVTDTHLDQLIQDGNTEEYLRLTRQEEKRREILSTAKAERQKAIDAKTAEEKEQLHQAAINHTQQLFEKMPELKDQQAQTKLAAYLKSSGLTDHEVATFIDHRGLIIAEKARRYDELSSGKVEPIRKDPPKVIKKVGATANKQTYTQKDVEESTGKLMKSGKLRDAAALYLKLKGA